MAPPPRVHSWNQYEKYYCEACQLWVFLTQRTSHEKSNAHQNKLRHAHRHWDRERQRLEREERDRANYMENLNKVAHLQHEIKDRGGSLPMPPSRSGSSVTGVGPSPRQSASIGPQMPTSNAVGTSHNSSRPSAPSHRNQMKHNDHSKEGSHNQEVMKQSKKRNKRKNSSTRDESKSLILGQSKEVYDKYFQ